MMRTNKRRRGTSPSRRKFISYNSSEWEELWLDNVDEWEQTRQICQVMQHEHASYMHDFLNLSCTHRYQPPFDNWCIIDDDYRLLWYDSGDRSRYHLSWIEPPDGAAMKIDKRPIHRQALYPHYYPRILSKFQFFDETTGEYYDEYIEPLVSHLRFPLSECISYDPLPETDYIQYQSMDWFHQVWFPMTTKAYIILAPPLGVRPLRILFWDAGASSWDSGVGGPSLSWFWTQFLKNDNKFDQVYAYEAQGSASSFYKTVPAELLQGRLVHYQQCLIASSPYKESWSHPFIPNVIMAKASPDDYVVFKLDIDSPTVEDETIKYILNYDVDDNIADEVAWEHHIADNYLMAKYWRMPEGLAAYSMRESYDLFLRMRQRGIRAHSWV